MNPSQPENLLSHKPHIITSQNKGRRLQPLHLFTDARILPTPYPLSDFSPKEHLQVERFIFCEIFHLSSARGSRLPGCGQFQEGSLSFLHRQGHTAPKWLLQRSKKPEMAMTGMLFRLSGACLPAKKPISVNPALEPSKWSSHWRPQPLTIPGRAFVMSKRTVIPYF